MESYGKQNYSWSNRHSYNPLIMQPKPLKTISSAIRRYVLMVSVLSFAIVFFLYIGLEYKNLRQKGAQVRVDYLNRQKATIKEEVTNAINLIEIKRTIRYNEILEAIKRKVQVGYTNNRITNRLYSPKSISELNQPSDQYGSNDDLCLSQVFSITIEELAPILSSGMLKTTTQEPITIEQAIESLKGKGECTLIHIDNAGEYQEEAIIHLIKPTNNTLVYGVAHDWTAQLKKIQFQILQEMTGYRFGSNQDGYIFVNTWSGDPLVLNGELAIGKPNIFEIEDPTGLKVLQKEAELAKLPNGGYMEYSWRKLPKPGVDTTPMKKISYIMGVKDWKLIIGAGLYLDEMAQLTMESEVNLMRTFYKSIIFLSFFLLLSFALTLIFAKLLQRKINKNTQSLQDFVTSITQREEKVNLKKWDFDFFDFNLVAKHIGGIELSRRAMEDNFKRLVSLYPNPTIIQTDDSIQYVNEAWINEVGYSKEDIPTINEWFELAYPDREFRASIIRQWSSFLENDPLDGKTVVELPVFCKDGTSKILAFRIIRVFEDQLMITLSDTTKQKKYEEELLNSKKKAEESDRLKSAFLANMSHEIRTPMNAIVGFSSLLQKPGLPETKKEKYITFIRNSGNTLLNLINDIIDISKIESGQLKIIFQETDVNKLLTEIFAIEREIFKREEYSGVNLYLRCVQVASMKVDPARLKQIFSNLISNARKFTPHGSVEFGFYPINEGDTTITFFCSDTGVGIPAERLPFIFERFRTYDFDSGERVSRGTGLGLSITQNLVELMGGTILVESEPGVGSTFTFNLPLKNSESKKRTISETKEDKLSSNTFNGKCILVCDDEAENYLFVHEILNPLKAEVIWTKNSKEAIKLVGLRKIDLIVMDLGIMDGVKAIKQIKISQPTMPILAVTEFVMQTEKIKCINAGCDTFINRPIDEMELREKIMLMI